MVFQTLLSMGCMPAGMEFFPATDEDQLTYIRAIIDECDYYVLIIGGRYGSLSNDGLSFTEKEFDYAVSKGMRVLVFTHGSPGDLPVNRSDIDPTLRARLEAFRQKAQTDRLVTLWTAAGDLAGKVAVSLGNEMRTHPAVGWVRANVASTAETLNDLNRIWNENENLRAEVAELNARAAASEPLFDDLQDLSDNFTFEINPTGYGLRPPSVTVPWATVFGLLAPHLSEPITESIALARLEQLLESLAKRRAGNYGNVSVDLDTVQTVKLQFLGLRLITVARSRTAAGGVDTFWELTELGQQAMFRHRLLRRSN